MVLKMGTAMRQVSKRLGKAVADYGMIEEGDRILVAVSGGWDSLALLCLLKARQQFAPVRYDLLAVTVDYQKPQFDMPRLEQYFRELGVDYTILPLDLVGEDGSWEENVDCFWCAWSRRKELFRLAEDRGYNKVALGHHRDDIVQTILMNMFYRGEVGAMRPRQELFGGRLVLIRPLAYETKRLIERMAEEEAIPLVDRFECPHGEDSKRKTVRDLLLRLEQDNPDIPVNIFRSLENVRGEYLLDK